MDENKSNVNDVWSHNCNCNWWNCQVDFWYQSTRYAHEKGLTENDIDRETMTTQCNPPKEWFSYPFAEIYVDIFRPLVASKATAEDAGNFPENIVDYIWGQQGCNDEEGWALLCKLDNDKYAYYYAWCDYTGFDCRSGMDLYIADDVKTLVTYAMNPAERDSYNRDNV